MSGREPSEIVRRYWAERGGKPQPRPRTPLTAAEEHAFLVAGSELCNVWEFYDGHDEWEEVWRRATGERRALLHGIIQVAVGYEHGKRNNPVGMASLLGQGADKLAAFEERPGVSELRDRALRDADRVRDAASVSLDEIDPPKIMLAVVGLSAEAPEGAIRIEIPRSDGG